jgi:hypothetical protein
MKITCKNVAAIFLICVTGIAAATQRMVVAEMQTNTSGPGCPNADLVLDNVADTIANVAIIRYHTWWPNLADPFYLYDSSEIYSRVMYYPPHYDIYRFVPYLWIDGTVKAGYDISSWLTYLRNERAVASPLDIQIAGDYNSFSRTGNLNLRIIATENITLSNLRLRIALTESNIFYTAPNGTTIHNQTFRDMLPDTLGIPVSIALGETLTFNQPFSCPRPLIERNCEFVAFVQSDSTRRILQGAKTRLQSLDYQIYPFSLISPPDYFNVYGDHPQFVWHKTIDSVTCDTMRYLVFLSREPSFLDPLISDTLRDTSWTCQMNLDSYVTYYWKVQAFSQNSLPKQSRESFRFSIQPPCNYMPGDINGDQTLLWGDVTSGVRYFKNAGSVPADSCYLDSTGSFLYVAADANGNCEFRGSDITRLVACFKGTAQLTHCVALPPVQSR